MLRVDGLEVRYGAKIAVSDVDLTIGDGEVLALLGPSGCGKSTLLRAIAGLEPTTAGTVSWDNADLAGVPVHRRDFGLVFQDGQLFPHRDVAANVAFGLETLTRQEKQTFAAAGPPQKTPTHPGGTALGQSTRSQGARMGEARNGGWLRGLWTTRPEWVADRVEQTLRLVGLGGFGDRAVTRLSGGEQQRVALARALAPRPRLLLLDEPLSALDRALREQLAIDLARVLRAAGSTALVVTHDHDEAFTLADRVAVMRAGRIVQVGRPDEVWRRPVDEDTARFLGFDHLVDASVSHGVLRCVFGEAPVPWASDGAVLAALRPSALRVGEGPTAGTVIASVHRRDHVRLVVETGHGEVDAVAGIGDGWEVGGAVRLALDPDGVALIGS